MSSGWKGVSRSRLAALVLAAAFLSGCGLFGGGRNAGKPPFAMAVQVGHANMAREGETTPVRVTLGGNDRPISGRLELDDLRGGRTEMAVELPPGASKVYTLFAELSRARSRRGGESAELTLREGGRVLMRQTLTPLYLERGSLYVSSSGDAAGLQALQKDKNTYLEHLPPADMPRHWAGYRPATAAVLNGRAWAAMDEEQRRALRLWVENGGAAVLCGESAGEWNDAEAQSFAPLSPQLVRPEAGLEGLRDLSIDALPASRGALPVASGPLNSGGFVVAEQSGRTLVGGRRPARGRVLWIGFDPFRPVVREWSGAETFWRTMMRELERIGPGGMDVTPATVEPARQAAAALPRLPAPSTPAVVGFGVVYAIIFGPVNVWVLRRMRRTVKSWLFVPALSLGMTAVALVAGQTWGSTRTVLNSVTILQGSAGSRTAREETLTGLFSPTNQGFDLSLADPAMKLVDAGGAGEMDGEARLGPANRQDDGAAHWDAIPLALFSTRLVRFDQPRDLGGAFSVRSGEVQNGTRIALKRAYLFTEKGCQKLGDLPAGGSAPFVETGWTRKPPLAAAETGGLVENQQFRENVAALLSRAPDELLRERPFRDSWGWLIGEADGARGSLTVSPVPYSNQATLMLIRIPRREGQP